MDCPEITRPDAIVTVSVYSIPEKEMLIQDGKYNIYEGNLTKEPPRAIRLGLACRF